MSHKELTDLRRGSLGCGGTLGGTAVAGLFVPERYDHTNCFSPVLLDLLAPLISATSAALSAIVCSRWLLVVMFGTTVRLGAWRLRT